MGTKFEANSSEETDKTFFEIWSSYFWRNYENLRCVMVSKFEADNLEYPKKIFLWHWVKNWRCPAVN